MRERSWAAVRQGSVEAVRRPRSGCRRRPPTRTAVRLSPTVTSTAAPVAASRTKRSGLTAPDTTDSPSPGTGVDDQLPPVAGDGVGGEHHPGHVRVDHPLHDDRQRDLGVVDALGGAVADRPLGPQRGPAAAGGVEHGVGADDVEVGVLLTGEAGPGQVLGGGRGADRHRYVVAERAVARRDGSARSSGTGAAEDDLTKLPAAAEVVPAVRAGDRVGEAVTDDPPVGRGGDAEAGWHGQVGPQHPTEVERLAADRRRGRPGPMSPRSTTSGRSVAASASAAPSYSPYDELSTRRYRSRRGPRWVHTAGPVEGSLRCSTPSRTGQSNR